jgi:hypothetical protein
MTVWHFQFFQVAYDGRRIGGDVMTDGSKSLEQAVEERNRSCGAAPSTLGRRPSVSSRAKTGRLFARSTPIRKGAPPGRARSLTA